MLVDTVSMLRSSELEHCSAAATASADVVTLTSALVLARLGLMQAAADVGQLCEDVGRLFLLDMLLGKPWQTPPAVVACTSGLPAETCHHVQPAKRATSLSQHPGAV
jgi:hypothetical protein